MANTSDRVVGVSFLLISTVIFLYYTTWVLVLPFVDEDKGIHNYFLPYHYAVLIPAALLVVGLTGVLSFLALVMINSRAAKKQR